MPLKIETLYEWGTKTVQSLTWYPENMVPGKKYPVLIFFPGMGETANDSMDIYTLCKNGPLFHVKYKGWKPDFIIVGIFSFQDFPDESQVYKALKTILAKEWCDNAAVFPCGLSAGAKTWFNFALHNAEAKRLIKGMVLMSSPALYSTWTNNKDNLKPIPVYAFHGDADGKCPLEEIEDMYKELVASNPKSKFYKYSGGHGNWNTYFSPALAATKPPYDWALALLAVLSTNTTTSTTAPAPIPEPVKILPMIKYLQDNFSFDFAQFPSTAFVYTGVRDSTFALPALDATHAPFRFIFRNRTAYKVQFDKPLQVTEKDVQTGPLGPGTYEIIFAGGKWHCIKYATNNI